MNSGSKPILVVGGGIGGLTAALALGRRGRSVRVVEQASEFGAIGFGIQLGPNVFPVFEQLGILDRILSACDFPEAISMTDAFSGEDIIRIETQQVRRRFGYPYVVLHRTDLHSILLEACRSCENVELEASKIVTGAETLEDGARVRLADGEWVEAAAVIGADGLRSTLRSQIIGDGEPKLIGYAAHRTIIPVEKVPRHAFRNEVVLWAGPELHIVHYPLRNGTLFNIVAVFKTPTHADKIDDDAYRAELTETYRHTHPAMRALLDLMELDRRWPIADRRPSTNWGNDHIVLLGDAAHPTLQSLAQGAGMAIEDGLCIAEAIEEAGDDFPEAFRRYADRRITRTARVQLESRLLWDFYHLDDPIAIAVRKEQYMAKTQDDYHRCLEWLWDGNRTTRRQQLNEHVGA